MRKQMLFQHRYLPIILFFSIIFFYLFTRFFNLLSLPIFNDEAIYIRWAQIITEHPRSLFISLVDGKQPLFIWVVAFFLKVFEDPLFAGRVASIFFGCTSLIGVFILTKLLFHKASVAFFAALLYILFPMALVYDRMALYESAMTAATLYSVIALVLLARKPSLGHSVLLGVVWGIGVLIKSTGFLTIALSLPVYFLLLPKTVHTRQEIIKNLLYLGIASVIALGFYSLLRFSEHFSQIEAKNAVFVYHFSELLPYGAFLKWPHNLVLMGKWTISYLSLPLFFFCMLSFASEKRYIRERLLLLLLFLIPFLLLGLFGRLLNPRYLLPVVIVLIPLAGFGVEKCLTSIRVRILGFVAVALLLFWLLRLDFLILSDFSKAPLPDRDLVQYANGWPAGWGMREIIAYLQRESEDKQIVVFTEGLYGSLPTTVSQIYLSKSPAVTLIAFDPKDRELSIRLSQEKTKGDVFVILNQLQTPKPNWPVRRIASYSKGESSWKSNLYLVE
ncbi:MAG: glycosyltransferase family 39 protein [Candidatus Levybacteria bacterium]|nr:glycosyltransferase family 39 protein [Candidatus Levybacteria bacterium]